MKKSIKYLLFISLLLIPNIVLAEEGEPPMLLVALGMELFCSIHMSVFVLIPLANFINKSKRNTVFCILFAIRLFILLIGDIIFPMVIAVIDFISIFIGAFIVIPVLYGIKGEHGLSNSKMSDYSEILDNEITNLGFNNRKTLENYLINKYMEISNCISINDLNTLNELCDRKLFTKFSNDIKKLELLNQNKVYSNINVNKCKIYNTYINSDSEEKVFIAVSMSYKETIIDKDKNVISDNTINGLFELEYGRTLYTSKVLSNCPNCGGEIEEHSSSVCQFCHCVLDNTNSDFKLYEIVRVK